MAQSRLSDPALSDRRDERQLEPGRPGSGPQPRRCGRCRRWFDGDPDGRPHRTSRVVAVPSLPSPLVRHTPTSRRGSASVIQRSPVRRGPQPFGTRPCPCARSHPRQRLECGGPRQRSRRTPAPAVDRVDQPTTARGHDVSKDTIVKLSERRRGTGWSDFVRSRCHDVPDRYRSPEGHRLKDALRLADAMFAHRSHEAQFGDGRSSWRHE
jgi:hypothetical protein